MNPGMGELVKRAIKYLVEGLMVAIVAFVIPPEKRALKFEEIAIIALMAAATFLLMIIHHIFLIFIKIINIKIFIIFIKLI